MSQPQASNRWLFGPVPDLFLGCGLGYAIVFAVLTFAGPQLRAAYPYGLLPLLVLIFSIPHYGATLLRVYERPEDRRKYAFFSVHLTALIALVFIIGVYDNLVGSLMITLYLTWSPWHYTGQNYGITLMFLGRRGIKISTRCKRLLHLSFVFSFLLTILEFHSFTMDQPPLVSLSAETYRIYPLGVPEDAYHVAVAVLGTFYVLCTAIAAGKMLRVASFGALLPSFLLMATQALWFLVPMFAQYLGVFQNLDSVSRAQRNYAFFWLAFGHAIQYLWITSFFARKDRRSRNTTGFLGKCLLSGAAIWVVPALLFAPGALGRLPYDAGLAALVAAAVNIHHFVLDGAIWKLRDGRIAKILLRPVEPSVAGGGSATSPPTRLWPRATIAVVGVVSVAVWYFATTEYQFGFRRALEQGDLARAAVSAERLAWLGRDSADTRSRLATLQAFNGDSNQALASAHAAVALHESSYSWQSLGIAYQRAGRLDDAITATFRASTAGEPSDALLNRLASLLVNGVSSAGPVRTVALETASALVAYFEERDARPLRVAVVAYAAAGKTGEAANVARTAIALAELQGEQVLAANLRSILASLPGSAGEPVLHRSRPESGSTGG